MSKRSRKNRNKGRNHHNHKRHEHEALNANIAAFNEPEVQEQETKVSYSEMSTNVIKTGAIATLKTISYIAETGIRATDNLTSDTIPAYFKIPSVPTNVISAVTSWVPAEAAGVISMAAPLLTLGDDIRNIDPTGIVDLYLMYNRTKTFLSCTKMAADFASLAIEKGSVKDATIANVQSIANKYIPSSIMSMAGSMFGR